MKIKTMRDLRENLANVLNELQTGKTDAVTSNAICSISGKILSSVKLELDYNKYMNANANIGFIGQDKKNNDKVIEHKKIKKTNTSKN